MIDARRAAMVAMALCLPQLQGCAAGLLAAQAVPGIIGGVALSNAEDRDPWQTYRPGWRRQPEDKLEALNARLLQAECGDAESQYWLAASMNNGFNLSPDRVEIYKWYRLAQARDYAPAAEPLSVLEASMPESDIETARERARQWTPRTEGCQDEG